MEYRKLSNSPLKFVLAEFKFSPILRMEKYIPDIQEAFRENYPIFKKINERVLKVNNDDVEAVDIPRWIFASSDKTKAIEINQESIIFFTSTYDRFNGFANNCQVALDVLLKNANPTLIQRIGLRYCDLILTGRDEKIEDFICNNLTCPNELIQLGTNGYQTNETLLKTNIGTLVIRSYYGTHNLSIPPDLRNRIPIAIQSEDSSNEKILLDFDHFWKDENNSTPYDIEKIITTLKELHSIARESFWKLTTEYARSKKWS